MGKKRIVKYLGTLLRGLTPNHGDQAELARKSGLNTDVLTRLKAGTKGAQPNEIGALFRAYAGQSSVQADLVVAYVRDQLPQELVERVQIEIRANGAKKSKPPIDDLDEAVLEIRASPDCAEILETIRMVIKLSKQAHKTP